MGKLLFSYVLFDRSLCRLVFWTAVTHPVIPHRMRHLQEHRTVGHSLSLSSDTRTVKNGPRCYICLVSWNPSCWLQAYRQLRTFSFARFFRFLVPSASSTKPQNTCTGPFYTQYVNSTSIFLSSHCDRQRVSDYSQSLSSLSRVTYRLSCGALVHALPAFQRLFNMLLLHG